MQIDLERKASSKLLAWKNKPNHSTLEGWKNLSGQ